VSYTFGAKHAIALLKGLSLQLTVNNVFDTIPPFDAANGRGPFYYSRYGSVRLRDYIIRVKKDF
jgi:outer membrane receptor protein involved in Fe transport